MEKKLRTIYGLLGPSTETTWQAVDSLDNWKGEAFIYNNMTGGDAMGESKAQKACDSRTASVKATFGSQLGAFLGAAYLWPYLDPSQKRKPHQVPVFITSGPFGTAGPSKFKDDPKGEPITKILVRCGARVDGVQLTYGGRAGALHGGPTGEPHSLGLEDGESVVKVEGRAGDSIDKLVFHTDKGRAVGGGGKGGSSWTAEPAKDTGATLVSIEGRQGGSSLDGITFVWRYFRNE